jgi:hypothetical protein
MVHFFVRKAVIISYMTYIKRKFWLPFFTFVLLVTLLTATDPTKLPLPVLILPFFLGFAFIYLVTNRLVLSSMQINRKRAVIISGVAALVPTLLLMFQSVHQLTIRDVLVIVGLAVATAFYIVKADFIS